LRDGGEGAEEEVSQLEVPNWNLKFSLNQSQFTMGLFWGTGNPL
jgi:hypothetical protein